MAARLWMAKARRAGEAAWPYLRVMAAAVPAALFAKQVVGFPATVHGNSMLPALHGSGSGAASQADSAFLGVAFRDVLWLRALGGDAHGRLQRGEVVVLRSASRPRKLVVKRVAALPGDCVATKRGEGRAVVVPPGHVWVEGDNASCSRDSTHFGAVPLALIVGRATHIVWPPGRAGSIPPPAATQPRPTLVGRVLRTDSDWQWAAAAATVAEPEEGC